MSDKTKVIDFRQAKNKREQSGETVAVCMVEQCCWNDGEGGCQHHAGHFLIEFYQGVAQCTFFKKRGDNLGKLCDYQVSAADRGLNRGRSHTDVES